MLDTRIILSITWIAFMLASLWGDVLSIFVGDNIPSRFLEVKWTQTMAFSTAVLMVIPILMVVLSLMLPYSVNRWANIIVAGFWFLFNLVGLRSYPGHYEKFILVVTMAFNVITVWYAWKWVA